MAEQEKPVRDLRKARRSTVETPEPDTMDELARRAETTTEEVAGILASFAQPPHEDARRAGAELTRMAELLLGRAVEVLNTLPEGVWHEVDNIEKARKTLKLESASLLRPPSPRSTFPPLSLPSASTGRRGGTRAATGRTSRPSQDSTLADWRAAYDRGETFASRNGGSLFGHASDEDEPNAEPDVFDGEEEDLDDDLAQAAPGR